MLDVEHAQCGIDLENDIPKLVDPRFANELFIYARIAREIIFLLRSLKTENCRSEWFVER